jgi:hypothetical protein
MQIKLQKKAGCSPLNNPLFLVYLGFVTNPKNGRVKALSNACLDRTYL